MAERLAVNVSRTILHDDFGSSAEVTITQAARVSVDPISCNEWWDVDVVADTPAGWNVLDRIDSDLPPRQWTECPGTLGTMARLGRLEIEGGGTLHVTHRMRYRADNSGAWATLRGLVMGGGEE